MTFEHRIGRAMALAGLAFVLVATLTPTSGPAAESPWCLVCGRHGGVDVTLNLLLFVPLAAGLRLAGVPTRRVVLCAALLTLFVEGMQLDVVRGREASLSDLLTNTAGGFIGAFLASRARTLLMPPAATARPLATGAAAAYLAVWLATAWLLLPWAPRERIYSSRGGDAPGYVTFTGRVTAASFAGGIATSAPAPADGALKRHLAADDVTLGFDAIVGRQRPYPAPAVALLARDSLIGAVFEFRDAAVLLLPTNAMRAELRPPALRLDRARPAAAGEPMRLVAGARDRTLWIASSYGGERRYRELALSPSFGWSLLLPFEYSYGAEVHFLTSLWIAGLLLPLGYWTRMARVRPARAAAGLGAVAVLALAVIPRLAGYPPVHPSEWLAACVGLAGGWAAASRVAYLAGRCASPSAIASSSS